MGNEAKRAIDQLREIGSGQSAPLRELDETGTQFRLRLRKVLKNLPEGEIIEVPVSSTQISVPLSPAGEDAETESPGDFAAPQAQG